MLRTKESEGLGNGLFKGGRNERKKEKKWFGFGSRFTPQTVITIKSRLTL